MCSQFNSVLCWEDFSSNGTCPLNYCVSLRSRWLPHLWSSGRAKWSSCSPRPWVEWMESLVGYVCICFVVSMGWFSILFVLMYLSFCFFLILWVAQSQSGVVCAFKSVLTPGNCPLQFSWQFFQKWFASSYNWALPKLNKTKKQIYLASAKWLYHRLSCCDLATVFLIETSLIYLFKK